MSGRPSPFTSTKLSVLQSSLDVVQTGVMLTYNDSKGSSTTKSMMIDLNGDGYPDIVAGGKVQYTNTLGGISGEVLGTIS